MSLQDFQGKNVRLNFLLKPKITIKQLEKDLAEMAKKKRISLATKNHRIALSRWIKSLVEDEIESFIVKLENAASQPPPTPSHATSPHALKNKNVGAITQMVPGGCIQVTGAGSTSLYPPQDSLRKEGGSEE
tara:strand:- start:3355 stop:3750 length:396 start_codon:yes stop_codon:yes gene_type:complete